MTLYTLIFFKIGANGVVLWMIHERSGISFVAFLQNGTHPQIDRPSASLVH